MTETILSLKTLRKSGNLQKYELLVSLTQIPIRNPINLKRKQNQKSIDNSNFIKSRDYKL